MALLDKEFVWIYKNDIKTKLIISGKENVLNEWMNEQVNEYINE